MFLRGYAENGKNSLGNRICIIAHTYIPHIFGGVQTTNVPTAQIFLSLIYILPFSSEYLREYHGLETPLPMSLFGTTIWEA
jgi:hypothetical protein